MAAPLTKKEQREAEIDQMQLQLDNALNAMARRIMDFPYEANLGTWKAIRNTIVRAKLDVDSFIDRDNARREAR